MDAIDRLDSLDAVSSLASCLRAESFLPARRLRPITPGDVRHVVQAMRQLGFRIVQEESEA